MLKYYTGIFLGAVLQKKQVNMQKGMESELFLEENWYRGNIYVNWVIEYTNCINNAIINL